MYQNLHQITCDNTYDNLYYLILIEMTYHVYYYPLSYVLLHGI